MSVNNVYVRTKVDGSTQVALSSTNVAYHLFDNGVIDEIPSVCNDGHFVTAHNLENIDSSAFNILYI